MYRFAGLLGTGIEIKPWIVNPYIVRARIVVHDPQSLSALDGDAAGMKGLVVLRYRAHMRSGAWRLMRAGDDPAGRNPNPEGQTFEYVFELP